MGETFDPSQSEEMQRQFRNSLGKFATGVTVITMKAADGSLYGLTANSFSSVSLDPPLVLWSIGNNSQGFNAYQKAEHFCISILAADQDDIAMKFAKSDVAKFEGVSVTEGLGGCPIIDNAIATFECTMEATYPGGDHVILVGRVQRAHLNDGDPLLFYQGKFFELSK